MALLKEKDRKQLKSLFEQLTGPVKLTLFTQEFECQYCQMTREMVEEVAKLNDLIQVTVYDLKKDDEQARAYDVEAVPALIMEGDQIKGNRIRFFGIPAGYEFSVFIEDILMVSKGDAGFTKEEKEELAKLDGPVHMQVLASPSCPYCPQASIIAHRLAMESPRVRADVISIGEFPYLTQKYNVQGVPMTVINEEVRIPGAVSDQEVISAVLKAGGVPGGEDDADGATDAAPAPAAVECDAGIDTEIKTKIKH